MKHLNLRVRILAILWALMVTVSAATAGQTVSYYGDVMGYLAVPENATDAPALILIHEWWGLNADIRTKADEFAAAGYVALAVDLYKGQSSTTFDGAQKLAAEVSTNGEAAFANLRAAADYLRALPQTDPDRLGSVGWCFGGGWSYNIAKNNLGAKASVIYYGRFNPADDFSQMRAKIIAHFGENDRLIKVSAVKEFQANLKTQSGEHEVFIYPNAGHSFANPENSAHDAQATKAAYQRTLDFLNKHL